MRSVATIAAALVVAALPAASANAAGPPKNFFENEAALSQPTFTETHTEVHRLRAFDGAELYIEVTKPVAPGRYPVILEASPYHGTLADRKGTRILPEPRVDGKSIGLTGYFAPRGYAVVMMDLRGTGRSRGCLDHLGLKDARDLKQVVEWAALSDWSNGRVGMTGHSYVGSTPSVAAAQQPRGLVTIVPSAGLASMYDHQFQGGVPYLLQWAGPQWSYEYISVARKLPPGAKDPVLEVNTGDDFGNNPQDTGCGAETSALVAGEDQLSGRYAPWHEQRDWTNGAKNFPGSVFLVHGVNDNAARIPAADWFLDREGKAGDKAWIGQWDHGSRCCPTRRGLQWTKALHSWFDKELAQRDVDTGPALEAFLADASFSAARTGARTEVLTADRWPADTSRLTFKTSGTGALTAGDATPGSTAFAGDPRDVDLLPIGRNGGAFYRTEPLTEAITVAGLPTMRLSASSALSRAHLIATLYEEYGDEGDLPGVRRRITQCAINPELRDGIATRSVVVPGQRYDMAPPCMAMAHQTQPGSRLVLRVATADPDKVPTFAANPRVEVFAGEGATSITLPVVDAPTVYPDEMPLQP